MKSPEEMFRLSNVGVRQSAEDAKRNLEKYKISLFDRIARGISGRIDAAASKGETVAAMELEALKRTRVGSGCWSVGRSDATFTLEAAELVRDRYSSAGYRADIYVDTVRDEGTVWLDGGKGVSSEVERHYLRVDWSRPQA